MSDSETVSTDWLKPLQDSTDRLHAVWCNLASIGCRKQIERNLVVIRRFDPLWKPDGKRRPNAKLCGGAVFAPSE